MAALAAENKIPAIFGGRDHVEAGGLISYGISFRASSYRMTSYIDRILKGAKAALPLEFPSKLELCINQKAAQSLGINIPTALLARADEVIE